MKPLIEAAGKDISHWFDQKTGEVQKFLFLNTIFVSKIIFQHSMTFHVLIIKFLNIIFFRRLKINKMNFKSLYIFIFVLKTKNYTFGGTRTRNPRLRRPMPYPLGHEGYVRMSSY